MVLSRAAAGSLLAPVLVLGLAACGADDPVGPTTSTDHLEPTFEAAPAKGRDEERDQDRSRAGKDGRGAGGGGRDDTGGAKGAVSAAPADHDGSRGSGDGAGGSAGDDGDDSGGADGDGGPAPTGPLRARVTDPRGDVRETLTTAPSYADLLAATLVREAGGWTLTFDLAGAVPARAEGDRTMNLVGYVDVDSDGGIDHEVLGHLSDTGWSGSYRSPDGARFGRESGVTASAQGSRVVLRFPLGHLGSARSLQWAAASEWGTHEQVATGTTATDHAPDDGAAAFPG